jgi:hypothetical protein
VAEVPSFEANRIHGESNLRTIPDGWRVLRTILRERVAPALPATAPAPEPVAAMTPAPRLVPVRGAAPRPLRPVVALPVWSQQPATLAVRIDEPDMAWSESLDTREALTA